MARATPGILAYNPAYRGSTLGVLKSPRGSQGMKDILKSEAGYYATLPGIAYLANKYGLEEDAIRDFINKIIIDTPEGKVFAPDKPEEQTLEEWKKQQESFPGGESLPETDQESFPIPSIEDMTGPLTDPPIEDKTDQESFPRQDEEQFPSILTMADASEATKDLFSPDKTEIYKGKKTLLQLLKEADPDQIRSLTNKEVKKLPGFETFDESHISRYRKKLELERNPEQSKILQNLKEMSDEFDSFLKSIPNVEALTAGDILALPEAKKFKDAGFSLTFVKKRRTDLKIPVSRSELQKKKYAEGTRPPQSRIEQNPEASAALQKFFEENDQRFVTNKDLVAAFPQYKELFTTAMPSAPGGLDYSPLRKWRRSKNLQSEFSKRISRKEDTTFLHREGINKKLDDILEFTRDKRLKKLLDNKIISKKEYDQRLKELLEEGIVPIKHLDHLKITTRKVINEASGMTLDTTRTKLVAAHNVPGKGEIINPVDHTLIKTKMAMIPDEWVETLMNEKGEIIPQFFLTIALNNTHRGIENRLIGSLLKKYNVLGHDFKVSKDGLKGEWEHTKKVLSKDDKLALKALEKEIKLYQQDLKAIDAQTIFYNPVKDKLVIHGQPLSEIPGIAKLSSDIKKGKKIYLEGMEKEIIKQSKGGMVGMDYLTRPLRNFSS